MYDNVRKPESDWYEAGYTAPRTDTAGTGCYDSYWSPSQAAAPKKKPHRPHPTQQPGHLHRPV